MSPPQFRLFPFTLRAPTVKIVLLGKHMIAGAVGVVCAQGRDEGNAAIRPGCKGLDALFEPVRKQEAPWGNGRVFPRNPMISGGAQGCGAAAIPGNPPGMLCDGGPAISARRVWSV
jgi:hypothetical protein